ncbi:1-acyl-sn-glycerol-3-phosphate acyltransferase delta isoform X2 [Nerophis ophidion]|uniref:1-acyl-sn-glycerol-3-phosphate acyltransferase delta isoform X2 n=1 Tax=Nerophis ophidion TaxID=159077 RepID=UPI002ADFDCAD|nr:1-acyl-sn-glycerol-3-phosphate acyltransferase delta isoform X2 [Nerophis ophidion]
MSLVQLLKCHFLSHLILCYVFLVSGLIVNLLQLCTLPLWLLSKQLARKVNCRLAYCICSQMVAALEWWSGTECTLYTDPKSFSLYGKENAIVVLNHSFEIDFLCGWTFCERFGVLGSSKVLAKKELAYVPIIGWMWYFMEIVFCKRKWEDDRKTVAQSLQNLRDYPEKYWEPALHQRNTKSACRWLKAKVCPNLSTIFYQELKASGSLFKTSEELSRLCTTPRLTSETMHLQLCWKYLAGRNTMQTYMRIPLELIPEDESECADWLHKLYQEKDSFQELYMQTGLYPGPTVSPPRRPWSLINWLFWSCLLLYPLGLLLAQLFASGSVTTILASVALCTAASVGVRWMIGQTEINRASHYGESKAMHQNNN